MPKIVDIDATPNPNARKFLLREPLSWGIAHSYENAEQAQGDALASALFAIPHVSNVFYIDSWLTVTQDGQADWDPLLREIAVPVRAAPAATAQSAAAVFAARASVADLSPEDKQRLDDIELLLDQQIRPYLQSDGGDLHVLSLSGNQLVVHYQGACGTCPSSISGTLQGIQNLLHTLEPDLEVIAA
ncbi:NifU family protein [Rhodoferax sp.]|uniref:NifU family protein n=1 Tax=Rhodoferax sp. TaxID=50421 RepID=UPI0027268326|nr:NifU family protein [Rhodoferax sp.]MDO9144669.1 NifU family protein [Rhodoferax sp.]MDP3191115.1 NifU family protein [Rhodoferax sp.]MDP3336190.1 NifU family protein [Rhodoferax sp.]